MSLGTSNNSGYGGVGMWASEVALKLRIMAVVLVFSVAIYLGVFAGLIHKKIPGWWIDFTVKLQIAKVCRRLPVPLTFTTQGYRYTAADILSNPLSYQVERALLFQLRRQALLSSLVFPITFAGAFLLLRWKNGRVTRGEHLRGMRLISEKELAKKARKQQGRLPFGSVCLPVRYEAEHVMIAGKTQVGKTVALMQQLEAIRKAGLPAVVYDFKGEYVEKFYRPGVDFIANPLDERGLRWNIFDDIDSIPAISAVAGSLIPPGAGEERFWCTAAQEVLVGVIAALHHQGRRSNEDLWQALSSPIAEIARLCASVEQGAAGLKYIEDVSGKQAAIVGAVLMSYVSWLEFACTGGGFAIKEWIANPRGSFVFITGRPEVENTLRPYISLLIDLLGKRFLSTTDDRNRRLFLVLDEFGNLQKLPSIKRLLTAGGSKGATVLLGFQDFAAIAKTYGREDAETILNSCGTSLVLKLADEGTARIFSGRFGETQDWEVTQTRSIGMGKSRDSVSYSRVKRTDRLILPSEIQGLPKLAGYLLIPEHEPARIQLRIEAANLLPARNPAFVIRAGLSLEDISAREMRSDDLKQSLLHCFTAPVPGFVPGSSGGASEGPEF
jgi:type IV secretory pathway TraG/TraD family ATPase VirD4